MQTFLPFADFEKTAVVLDARRLGKQRVEAMQLIDTILERPTKSGKIRQGWKNHPAAVMWRNYVPALQRYHNVIVQEWVDRGYTNNMSMENVSDSVVMPYWLGDEDFHASHRSKLLFKGKVDILGKRITKHFKIRSANRWLKDHNYKEMSGISHDDYDRITSVLDDLGVAPSTEVNFYSTMEWSEPDNLDYIWPQEKQCS